MQENTVFPKQGKQLSSGTQARGNPTSLQKSSQARNPTPNLSQPAWRGRAITLHKGRGGWDGPEAAGSTQGRGRHAHVWPRAPKTSLALRSGTASERAVASREQPHGGAGTCLPHIPVVLAPCHRFRGHLISPTEAGGVLVSWVLSGRLCLFLVLVPA